MAMDFGQFGLVPNRKQDEISSVPQQPYVSTASGMDTHSSSAHLASLDLCLRSSMAKATDLAVTLTSGKLLETSGDVTVKSNAAGLPIIQFSARTSAGHLLCS